MLIIEYIDFGVPVGLEKEMEMAMNDWNEMTDDTSTSVLVGELNMPRYY